MKTWSVNVVEFGSFSLFDSFMDAYNYAKLFSNQGFHVVIV